MTGHIPVHGVLVPEIDDQDHLSDRQSDLLIHFLALAVVFVRYIPRIGQNSLPMFCHVRILIIRRNGHGAMSAVSLFYVHTKAD